jgi:hypothetical protein
MYVKYNILEGNLVLTVQEVDCSSLAETVSTKSIFSNVLKFTNRTSRVQEKLN